MVAVVEDFPGRIPHNCLAHGSFAILLKAHTNAMGCTPGGFHESLFIACSPLCGESGARV